MNKSIVILLMSMLLYSCSTSKIISEDKKKTDVGSSKVESDRITISNPDEDFEVIIFDVGFDSWLVTNAKPRGYYDLAFLEAKNRSWVNDWNSRASAGYFGFDYTIDFKSNVNYGYEVNYMLYNYLLYWQEMNNVKLN